MPENELNLLTPRQTFEDNMRPAHLLLRVYRLLDSNDSIVNDGNIVKGLRTLIQADANEELLLIYNELFLGLVRERAEIRRSHLLQRSLGHLLRQAIVASCTALETFLPALLKVNMPVMIRAKGRDILPANDGSLQEYFKDLTFSLEDTLRLVGDPIAPQYISEKMLGYIHYNYLSSRKGIHLAGALLGLAKPWEEIAKHLQREKKELIEILENTVDRRNDIVHRADRSKKDPTGDPQEITYIQTQHAIDTVYHVCMALNELVERRIVEINGMLSQENDIPE